MGGKAGRPRPQTTAGGLVACSAESGDAGRFAVGLGVGDAVFGSFHLAAERGYYTDSMTART